MSSFEYFPTPVLPDLKVRSFIPALTILTEHLRDHYDAGDAAGETTTPMLLGLRPDSIQAAAYLAGVRRAPFAFDDLRPDYVGRHHLAKDLDFAVPLLLETGGHGQSHEDNRDMLAVA